MKRKLILYHYPCPDGIFAALSAYLYFKDECVFVPHTVFSKPEIKLKKTDCVFFLDYCGESGFLKDVAEQCESVVVLDHHKTALEAYGSKENLPSNVSLNIDISRSGAKISWDYFTELAGKPLLEPSSLDKIKSMIDYVEDQDLWLWKLDKTKPFGCGLAQMKLDYDAVRNPSIFNSILNLDLPAVVLSGEKCLEEEEAIVNQEVDKAFLVNLGGDKARFGQGLAVFTTHSSLRSQIGNALARRSHADGYRAIGCVVYEDGLRTNSSEYKVSIRSASGLKMLEKGSRTRQRQEDRGEPVPSSSVDGQHRNEKNEEEEDWRNDSVNDTTAISEAFGGGGHLNASSCMVDEDLFNWTWRV
eukprot:GCRY01003642.1.p1 GENE.GCRY01003642.1~~GCRY01003642.1.p1  ORF type:complete len:358 (+),score=78.76 GCRY01003642.1:98-1171(+)